MEQNPTDDELRSYLLGELPEPKADALEERILKNDELFDLVEGLEADLLDAAIRGELAPAERKRILERLASSPEGRGRLALARSLNTMVNETARVVPFRPRPKQVFQWASTLAATGLLAAAGLFLFLQQQPQPPHGGDSPEQTATESPTPKSPVLPRVPETTAPETGTPPSPVPDQVAGKREETPEVRPEPILLQLALATLRGPEDTIEKRSLPPNTGLEIQLDLEESDSSGTFHVTVSSSKDKKVVWEETGLRVQGLDWTSAALVLDIPAELLKTGRYEVAVAKDSEPEMTQEFDIIREAH